MSATTSYLYRCYLATDALAKRVTAAGFAISQTVGISICPDRNHLGHHRMGRGSIPHHKGRQ